MADRSILPFCYMSILTRHAFFYASTTASFADCPTLPFCRVTGGGRSVLRKRTKSIRFDNSFRSLKEPLQHLPDSNGWLYSLQLNTYRYMLESEYGMQVSGMYLAQVHPCLARGRLIEVPRMEDEMVNFFLFRSLILYKGGRGSAGSITRSHI